MTDAPFICYRELVPSTSVIQSTFFRSFNSLTKGNDEYLCTLLAGGINIYKVCKESSHDNPFLSLHCHKRLYGKPNNVCALKMSNQSSDMLVLSVDAAKTIVFRCNMEINELETILLCNCEEYAFGPGSELQVQLNGMRRYPGVGNECAVCVCPDAAIVCNTVYGQFLAVLPITSTSSKFDMFQVENENGSVSNDWSSAEAVGSSNSSSGFCVDVNRTLGLPGPIIDTCFLTGYSRPVLVILQQSGMLPIGHAARVRHCCTVTALAVSAGSKTLSVLWQRTHLPYDALRLLPLAHAAYTGSVCVVCMNAVLVLNQEEAQGVAMNGFAAVTVCTSAPAVKGAAADINVGVKSGDIGLQSWVAQEEGLELDGSLWIEHLDTHQRSSTAIEVDGEDAAVSSRHAIVGTLKDGSLLRIGMVMSTPGMLSSLLFTPEVVAASVRASCFCASPTGDLWFLGSRQATCVLLAVDRVESTLASPRISTKTARSSMDGAASSFLSPATKRARSLSVVTPEAEADGEEDGGGLRRLHHGATDTPPVSPTLKKVSSEVKIKEEEETMKAKTGVVLDVEDEELALYGGSLTSTSAPSEENSRSIRALPFYERLTSSAAADRLELTVVDAFPVLGPVLHGLLTKQDSHFDAADALTWERLGEQQPEYRAGVQSTAASYIAEREARDGLVLATGLDADGALLRVYSGLHLTKLATKNLIGAVRVFTVACEAYSVLLVVYEDKTRAFHCAQDFSSDASSASKERSELKFKELSGADCGLISAASTLNVGFVQPEGSSACIAAQVVPEGVRLVRLGAAYGAEGDPMQDALLSDSREMGGLGGDPGERVLFGDVCAGYVTLLTSTRSLYVLKYDAAEEILELVSKTTDRSSTDVANGEATMREGGGEASLHALLQSEIVSASLFVGMLDTITPVSAPNGKQTMSVVAAAQSVEEIFLYGAVVPPEGSSEATAEASSSSSRSNDMLVDSAVASLVGVSHTQTEVPVSESPSQAYLVITELTGALTIVRLSNMAVVFQGPTCSTLPACMSHGAPAAISSSEDLRQEGLVIETKLARLSDPVYPEDASRSVLTLALLLSTGDLVTYRGAESRGFLQAFHKVDQCSVANKRAPEGAKEAAVRSLEGFDAISRAGEVAELRAFLSSPDYVARSGPSLSVASAHSGGRSGILVAGNDALMVTSAQGLPSIIALGFPEVPFINYGHHSVVPLIVGNLSAVAALWFECEDLETLKSPASAAAPSKANRAATLGIYQQAPGVEVYAAGGVSVRRVQVGRTVHRVAELQNHSDDRTQQALLEKKTFLLACSEESKQPFLPSVLTEEELQEDSELYERYFTSLNSFCQPDSSVGQPPAISARVHSLALVQGTSVVDNYPLPLNECVVDAQVLYLNLEKYITMPGSIIPMRFTERRVFVAACTAQVEKRGEDTQGNGRLLFFALDYALFEKDAEAGDANIAETSVTSSITGESSSQHETVTADAATKAVVPGAENKDLSSAQAKFLGAIKPKLRLLWSGPGPASVVRQLGEYVLSTVASTVYVYKFNTGTMDLEQVAFYFTQLYITSVTVLKNFVLVGDMHHSVQLLCWRELDHSLSPVSRDYEPTVPLCTEFLYDNAKLGMLMTDDEGNLQMFQQNPRKAESIQGSRLLCLADFHLGSDASLLLRHDLLSTDPAMKAAINPLNHRPPPPPPRSRKGSNFPLQRFGTRLNKATFPAKATVLVGTMDGGLAVLQPLEERMYRRLALLQQIMTMTVQTSFSLNPREYRLLKTAHMRVSRKKGVLDGCLLSMFCALPPSMQDQLAATVGATAYLIKENLHELDYLCRYF